MFLSRRIALCYGPTRVAKSSYLTTTIFKGLKWDTFCGDFEHFLRIFAPKYHFL